MSVDVAPCLRQRSGRASAWSLLLQLTMLPRIPALQRVRFVTLGQLLTILRARISLIATALAFVAQFSAYTYVAPHMQELVPVSPTTTTVELLACDIPGIAGDFVAGVTLSRSITGTLAVTKVAIAIDALPLGLQTWMSQAAPDASDGRLALS